MTKTFTINIPDIYNEVARTTAYTGAKIDDDEKAYQRIFTTDQDRQQLARFFDEASAVLAQHLMRLVTDESRQGDTYTLTLDVSASFVPGVYDSMQQSLRSYFVLTVTAKWFTIANKAEAGDYAEKAAAMLEDFKRKAYTKGKPAIPARYINNQNR